MMKRICLLLLLLCCILTACSSSTEAYLDDPITHFGDLSYYRAIDAQSRSSLFVNKHISLSGVVAAGGYTTLFLGEESKDGISFSCTFPVYDDALAAIQPGDHVMLHGICTAVIGNIFYMEHCSLIGSASASTVTIEAAATQPSTTLSAASEEPTVPTAAQPTVPVTAEPTVAPTAEPTVAPTTEPTVAPTAEPTVAPTAEPTVAPTTEPTVAPTAEPTVAPTAEPTVAPTTEPTVAPTTEPTVAPTAEPTVAPTAEPTVAPTAEPTVAPTAEPTVPAATDSTDETEQSCMVWIPKTGSKYHSKATCSGMKSPSQVTKEEAESRGYTPCKRCW